MTSSNRHHSLRPLEDLWDVIAHDELLEVVTAHFLPGEKGNLVSDFHTWLGGNFSGDLTRGTVLTSLVVDFLHGKLPPHERQTAIGDHLGQLIDRLVRLGRTISTTFSAMHAVDSDQIEDDTNRTLFSEIVFHLWHDVCALRRILVRIERALNTSLFSAALNASKFDLTITGKTIQEISNLNSTITRELLLRSKNIVSSSSESSLSWMDVAVLYESTLILRSRGDISRAINYAGYGKEHLSERIQEGTLAPTEETPVCGMVAFNPLLLSLDSEPKKRFEDAGKRLFSLSLGVTLNSSKAAKQGLQHSFLLNMEAFRGPWETLLHKIRSPDVSFDLSSILHIESTLRVLLQNYMTNFNLDDMDENAKPIDLTKNMIDAYESLERIVALSDQHDEWFRGMMVAKIQQDAGMLFSNITPVFLIDRDWDKAKDKDKELSEKVYTYIQKGWEREYDRPVIVRTKLRRAIVTDMIRRSLTMTNRPLLTEMKEVIGDPTVPNPHSSKGFSEFLWGSSTKPSSSRHLKHFPQGNVNKAQVSTLLAYIQCLEVMDEQQNKYGPYDDLDRTFKFTKMKQWGLTKENPKPQFTIGHVGGFKNDIVNQLRKATGKDKIPNFRKYLTRVNRMDSLMFLGTSLNLIEDLLVQELGEDAESSLDEAARASNTLDFEQPNGQYIHVHDVINAAQEASQSPMWLPALQDLKDNKEDDQILILNQLFRNIFSRLYFLSLRTEQLARVLSEQPLRQPYLNSCALIIDQNRVLLKFLITNWKKNAELLISERHLEIDPMFDQELFESLQKYFGKNKGHLGYQFNIQRYVDRSLELAPPLNDVALAYYVSNSVKSLKDMAKNLDAVHKNLEFTESIGVDWKSLLLQAVSQKYEGSEHLDDNSAATDVALLGSEDTDGSNSERAGPNEPTAVEALKHLDEHTEREWILWARLAFYPLALDGRILRSGTTFSELNKPSEILINKPELTTEGTSLIWKTTLIAYRKPFTGTSKSN